MTDREYNNSLEGKVYHTALKADVQNSIKKALMTQKNGRPYYETFLENYLEMAHRRPESSAAKVVAETILGEDLLARLDSQVEKQMTRNIEFLQYQLIKTLFDKQRDVLLDNNIRHKCIICGRRSGKTELAVRMLLFACATPNSPCFYVNLTFDNGIRQIWAKLLDMAEKINLAIESASAATGYMKFANGSSIQVRGNNNIQEIEKFRGFSARLIIIDECQSQKNLNYMINEVLTPLMFDYDDSVLIMQGTPPRNPHNLFEETFVNYKGGNVPSSKSYYWNMFDNPWIPNPHKELEDMVARKGLTMDSALVRREYLGEVGVYDTEAIIFKDYKTFAHSISLEDMDKPKDYTDNIPQDFIPTHIFIGNDYGWAASNAIIGLAADCIHKKCYVYYEHKFNKATVTQIVDSNKIAIEIGRRMLMRGADNMIDNICIYGDTSDNSIIYEMQQTYNLPASKCYKYNRDIAIEQLSEEMRTGRMLIPQGGALALECDRTMYKRDANDVLLNEIDDDMFHPDGMFALLYASRQYFFEIGDPNGGEASEL